MSLGPLMISLRGTSVAADEREWLLSPTIGGVILFSRNFETPTQLAALVQDIHALRSPSLLVAVDQEGGRVQRFRDPFTRLPPMRTLGHLYDERAQAALQAARDFGWLMAAELLEYGIDMSFAPCVDLDRGLADVIGDRALHTDAEAVARLAVEFVAGMEAAGMVATAKHFPTHAGVRADSHTDIAVDRREYVELYDDLLPYRQLIASGLHAVMMAHVAFPALDERPASLSRWWIETELRRELRFTGAVISDDMSMAGAGGYGSPAERIRAALDAGCDLVLLCNAPDEVPAVLESLAGFTRPAAQLRLMRLRGRFNRQQGVLRDSPAWQQAAARVAVLGDPGELELEG
jgi:beta-N-acetylhexosaminidase